MIYPAWWLRALKACVVRSEPGGSRIAFCVLVLENRQHHFCHFSLVWEVTNACLGSQRENMGVSCCREVCERVLYWCNRVWKPPPTTLPLEFLLAATPARSVMVFVTEGAVTAQPPLCSFWPRDPDSHHRWGWQRRA